MGSTQQNNINRYQNQTTMHRKKQDTKIEIARLVASHT